MKEITTTLPANGGRSRRHFRQPAHWALHGLVFALSGALAFLLRFDFTIPREYVSHLIAGVGIWVTVKLAVMHLESMDRGWAQFLSSADVARLMRVNARASIFSCAVIVLLGPPGFPRSLYFIDLALASVASISVRMLVWQWDERAAASMADRKYRRTLVYGTGAVAEILLQDIKSNPRVPYLVVGFVDDNPAKRGMLIHGIRVLGTGARLAETVRKHRVEEVLIAMPSATGIEMAAILERCHEAGVTCKTASVPPTSWALPSVWPN